MSRRQIAMSITLTATLAAFVFGSVANAEDDRDPRPVIVLDRAG